MDYGQLLGDAWRMVWGHRRLWLLGLLAGFLECSSPAGTSRFSLPGGSPSGVGAPPAPSLGETPPPEFSPEAAQMLEQAGVWLGDHWLWIAAVVLVLLLLLFVVLVLALIARAALVSAVARLDLGEAEVYGSSFRLGVRRFWPLLGLALLLCLLQGVPAAIVAAVVAFFVAQAFITQGQAGSVAGAVVAALLAFALLVLYSIPLNIVGEYALRTLMLGQTGPLAAIGRGFRMLRRLPGASLILWLTAFATRIAATVVAGIAVVALLVALALAALALGLTLYALGTLLAVAVSPAVVAAVILVAAALLVNGIVTAFLSAFWTLAFQRLQTAPAVTAGVQPGSEPPSGASGEEAAPGSEPGPETQNRPEWP